MGVWSLARACVLGKDRHRDLLVLPALVKSGVGPLGFEAIPTVENLTCIRRVWRRGVPGLPSLHGAEFLGHFLDMPSCHDPVLPCCTLAPNDVSAEDGMLWIPPRRIRRTRKTRGLVMKWIGFVFSWGVAQEVGRRG